MQIANAVKYSHGNDAGCSNALCCKCPFGMRVSRYTDVMMEVRTGRDDQEVPWNRNGGANIAVQSMDQRLEGNKSTK